MRQIADTVRDVVAPVPIVHGPERPADAHIAQISGARATDELGWQPATPFVDGVRRYVEWLAETSELATRGDGVDDGRQRRNRPAPGADGAVVIGVVQQHDVAAAE